MTESRCPECGKTAANHLYCNYCGFFFEKIDEDEISVDDLGSPDLGNYGQVQSSDTSTSDEK